MGYRDCTETRWPPPSKGTDTTFYLPPTLSSFRTTAEGQKCFTIFLTGELLWLGIKHARQATFRGEQIFQGVRRSETDVTWQAEPVLLAQFVK